MADIYVNRRCAVVSRTSLVFSWTGQGGTWVLVAMNGLSTGLTSMTSVGNLFWLVDCVLELSSGFQLDRTYKQLASGSPKGIASETVVYHKAWLSWQGAQTDLTGWTDKRE